MTTESSKLADEKKSTFGTMVSGAASNVTGVLASGASKVTSVGQMGMRGMASLSRAGFGAKDKLGSGYGKALGFYDRLFYKDINKDFGDHLEVASRGACFVVVCAIPFVVPSEICPSCNDIVQQGIFSAACVTYFIYTLYLYTGDILHFAQGGIMGTVLAVFNIWLMQGFMPGGYTESMPHRWYIGTLWGIMFTFLVLWLNFDDNTRIFGLSTYVWYWMSFLQPDATGGFSQNFEIRADGRAIKEFMVAVTGCGIAVVAAYVPYPIYAHTKALDTAKKMVAQVYMTKLDFVKFYCGDKADQMAVRILGRELNTLREEAGVIAGLLDTAWYECLGMGKWQKQRVMMYKFSDYSIKAVDLMSNVFQICQSETFDRNHVETMQAIKEPLNRIIESNGDVLKFCLGGLYEGSFNEEVVDEARTHIEAAKKAVQDMTANLEKSRTETGYSKISEDSSGENVVALTFAKFTHFTEEFYDSLQGEQKEERSWRDGAGIAGLFEPSALFDKDHLNWTLRNSVSIIISFYIGWHGYNQYIAKYNAAIASTVAVLLSKFVGSAMVKNLARLQGVVIGIVLGNLLYAFLAWCYWWGHLLVAIALYLWTLMGLFMYFHSANYSTVGLLLAVFGSQALLKPCANDDTNPSGHSAIVNVTIGICVMTIIDLLLSPARASDMTKTNFRDACNSMIDAIDKLFDHNVKTIESRGGSLKGAIGAAAFMGNEAALEPRYWRHDWPTAKFDQAISCLKTLRFCLDSIENIVLDKNGNKKQLFIDATKLPACKGVDPPLVEGRRVEFVDPNGLKAVLVSHTKNVMEAIATTIEDLAGDDVFINRLTEIEPGKLKAILTFDVTWREALDAFCNALNTDKEFVANYLQAKSVEDISDDPLADCSLVVESVKAMFTDLDAALQAVVS